MSKQLCNDKGFTLVELMVTIAIIAILAGIGWPLFSGYTSKGHRADAILAITRAQGSLESCYSKTRNYATCTLPFTALPAPNDHFNVTFTAASPDIYSITATGTASQQSGDTNCISLTLTNTGLKSSIKFDPATSTYSASTGCWPSN